MRILREEKSDSEFYVYEAYGALVAYAEGEVYSGYGATDWEPGGVDIEREIRGVFDNELTRDNFEYMDVYLPDHIDSIVADLSRLDGKVDDDYTHTSIDGDTVYLVPGGNLYRGDLCIYVFCREKHDPLLLKKAVLECADKVSKETDVCKIREANVDADGYYTADGPYAMDVDIYCEVDRSMTADRLRLYTIRDKE